MLFFFYSIIRFLLSILYVSICESVSFKLLLYRFQCVNLSLFSRKWVTYG
nr:MAG TPA: hypothetical protein [Caudoviricetes sp.]